MIIETPKPSTYSAAILMGRLDCERDSAGELDCSKSPWSMAVVMKAAYDLVAADSNVWRMVAVADLKRSAIVMADEHNLESSELDLTYEADTALAKAKADIIVLGFVSLAGGAVVVSNKENENTWLTRTELSVVNPDADMKRNLFGFEPREGESRSAETNNLRDFASMHRRRSGVFNNAGSDYQLPSKGLVKIYQRNNTTAGEPNFAVQLPDLKQGIRLRVYCGHGPDEAPFWRKVNLGLMCPDTLIVEPSKRQAVILWRCRWNADLEPMNRYRKVQIREGGF